jgi:hypothetical protein
LPIQGRRVGEWLGKHDPDLASASIFLRGDGRRRGVCRPHRGSVAQTAELPALTRGRAGSTPAGATHGRTATGAVSRLENEWVARPWGFDSLSFLSSGGVASWNGSALLARGGERRPQVRILPPPSPPRSSADSEQWASNPRAPVRIGPGCPCDATSFNGRTTGC